MKVCIFGLWHLGCVTAACVSEHFPVIACDPDAQTIAGLVAGNLPISEPGLKDLVQAQTSAGRLAFVSDFRSAVAGADTVWVTFDTPVDEDDNADIEFVASQIRGIFRSLTKGTLVLISSQVPVGFTARMEADYRAAYPEGGVSFAYSPENLRLGKALGAFRQAERIIVGVRSEGDRQRIERLLTPFSGRLEWMGVESAEMTKHALNAFLANSVAFINEIAILGESAGADAKEVERGLKSDVRIGPRAYLSAGGAFAGGTLARDVSALRTLADRSGLSAPLIGAIAASNQAHKDWPRRKLRQILGELSNRKIAILGLTYKPGTDTLRRSSAVELCRWVAAQGGVVQAYDPAIHSLPPELGRVVRLCASSSDALDGAHAAVIATEWPEFGKLSLQDLGPMQTRIILDPNRFVDEAVREDSSVVYAAVGYQRGPK
jgi:UDPglucose 6-dehydrogenase